MGAVKSAKDGLVSGLALFGLVASATAVLRLIDSQSIVSFGSAINFILSLYQNFFYPIVDLTIGKILVYFGIKLDSYTKDIIVLYMIISSSMLRLFYRRLNEARIFEENTIENKSFLFAVAMAIFWPISVPLAMLYLTIDLHLSAKWMEEKSPGYRRPWAMRRLIYTSGFWAIALPVLKEVMKVIAIAGVAIFLDAADVL